MSSIKNYTKMAKEMDLNKWKAWSSDMLNNGDLCYFPELKWSLTMKQRINKVTSMTHQEEM